MTEIFKMPDIGEGMHEGDIANWLVKVGDVVKEDDPVAEVQNDKLMQEILSPYSGTVTKLFVEAGTTVEVGAPLIEYDGDGSSEAAPAEAAPATASEAPASDAQIFTMPDIGEGMHEGDIANWLVKVGDEVKEDDPVAEVQNDKLMQEILSPYSGKVTKLFVEAGTTVEVGAPLIEYNGNGSGTAAPETPKAPEAAKPATSEAPAQPATGGATTRTTTDGRVLAMPSVRHYAREHGIDLTQVQSTGRHGHTTLADVKAFASGAAAPKAPAAETAKPAVEAPKPAAPKAAPAPVQAADGDRREPMTPTRKAISNALSTQNANIPAVTNFDQVEVSKLVAHRKEYKEIAAKQDVKLTYLAYVTKALAATAKKFPEINASIDGTDIVYHNEVNIGIAVNAPSGLYVPVIKNADKKSIFAIAKEIAELAEAVRTGAIKPDQMRGSTITISNIGSARGTWFTPIINGSDVMILGLGSIVKEPIVNAEGELAVGQNMKLSVSYDHRLIDGMLGQGSLNYLKSLLADPAYMLMEV
ncbi:2-oxo acid dehydrogenase subunit E2 [Lactococcus garvieae]|uniref:Dihydrolipoamide acetyltransferase component of pyruvate dehydrogenase complex n=1 Tax=Lactococcus garvieae DCC43 TaxID=1231377 RepID=K2PIF5_9LACT|nr:2-oxo acid dehydrogenase subunit E2 [Lactococcus garvieae]EKF51215.1 Dihydrolipoamide acetyltransferase component (E2) of acetoin dehydrogenase complex [Lactococcus garvieae DCC43]